MSAVTSLFGGSGGSPATQTQQTHIPAEFSSWIFGPGGGGGGDGGGGTSRLEGTATGAMTGAQIGSNFGPWGAAIGGIGGGLAGLIGSKKSSKNANRQNAALSNTHGFAGVLPTASALYEQGMLSPDLVQSQFTQDALTSGRAYADTVQQNYIPMMEQMIQSIGQRDLVNDPLIQQMITNSTRPIQEQLDRYGVPLTQDSAIAAGQLGSSRQGIAEGLARSDANNQMGDIATNIQLAALNEQMTGERFAAQMMPQLMEMGAIPTSILQHLGQVDETYLNDQAQSEARNLQAIASLLQGFMPGASTTQTQTDKKTGLETLGSLGTLAGIFMNRGAGATGAGG